MSSFFCRTLGSLVLGWAPNNFILGAQLAPGEKMLVCMPVLWLVLLSARMKKIHPKMKVLEWSQHFSHYKSIGIFPDAQGQLTHKSLVRLYQISNPFEILWLSLLPARIKKNKSKMKELEWSQQFPHYNPMGAICYLLPWKPEF